MVLIKKILPFLFGINRISNEYSLKFSLEQACFLANSRRSPVRLALVGNRQTSAAFGSTGSQNTTAIMRGHSFTESVFVEALANVGLKCTFHLFIELQL